MTLHANIAMGSGPFVPIYAVTTADASASFEQNGDTTLARVHEFSGQSGRVVLVPASDGSLARVYFGLGSSFVPAAFGGLAAKLPAGDFQIATPIGAAHADAVLSAYLLGAYVYDRYKTKPTKPARLFPPEGCNVEAVSRIIGCVAMGRDLVNTPPNDMGPDALEAAALALGHEHGAEIEVIKGEELLKQNYPLIHAVGKASAQEPRLVILRIGDPDAPKVALVGKGVTFDSGGLNLKPGSGMALMKKDMGGAACVLALFSSLAQKPLNIRLSVYVAIVENSMDGKSFRPSDVITARNGLTVEIDNTDAEGRLILADAVTRASEDGNGLIFDMATLTGAARVALGPELPPFFTDDEAVVNELTAAALATGDHLWRMPLWRPYEDDLESSIANLKNSGGPFAGAINGALFINKFVATANNKPSHCHFDVYCWNPKEKPGRPQGGEVHGVRAIDAMLRARFN
jgi:leucyl aminopeptidase